MPSEAESSLRSQLVALVQVLQSSASVLLPNSTHELLDSIVEAAARILGARAASMALFREPEGVLEFVTAYGPGGAGIIGRRISADQGLAGFVLMTEQALVISDVEHDPRFNREFAASTGYIPQSVLAAPLDRGGKVVGVMEVLDKEGDTAFAIQDLEMMEIFGQQAAIAIEQNDMLDQLDQAMREGLRRLAGDHRGLEVPELLGVISGDGSDRSTELRSVAHKLGAMYASGPEEQTLCRDLIDVMASYVKRRQQLH
jgi:GAF domain-containing protein